jgi:hypothetical protein
MKGQKDASIIMGQFIGYEIQDGYQIKRLHLLTSSGIQSIKLSKEAKASLFRLTLDTPLQPGMSIALHVTGKQSDDVMKLKAYSVSLCPPSSTAIAPLNHQDSHAPQTEIRVCDRGTCHKRGANQVYKAICQEVVERGLTGQITVQKTGCLKDCKHGVNVKINKTCHHNVCPAQAAYLIEQNVPSPSFVTV